MRPRNPVLLRRPVVENEETEGSLAHDEEVQDDRGRKEPDPDELRKRAAEASADVTGARTTMMGGAVDRREEQQQDGGDDPDRDEPTTRRQRVARAVVQLRALFAMTGKTESTQCWDVTWYRMAVVSAMCASQSCKNSACKTTSRWPIMLPNLHEPLARPAKETHMSLSGPNLEHRDDVEQLMGHRAVTYVTKILDTNEAILTESRRRETLKE